MRGHVRCALAVVLFHTLRERLYFICQKGFAWDNMAPVAGDRVVVVEALALKVSATELSFPKIPSEN